MSLAKNHKLQGLVYVLVSICFYIPAHRYGMVTDFLSWIYKYQAGSASDIVNSFGYRGLHPVFHFFNYTFFSIFALNKMAWCIFFALLHGVNAYLLKTVVCIWLKSWNIKKAEAIAVLSSICFLVGPYQVEVVTWEACMHYLLSAGMILGSFYFLLLHLRQANIKKWIIFHHLLFVLALFTLEVSLAVPFIFLCFILFHRMFSIVNLPRHLLQFTLPQMIIIVVYFTLNKLFIGEWVGHYGADTHFDISVAEIIGNAFKYFFKYFLLSHYWDYSWKDFLYPILEQKYIAYPLFLISLGLMAALVARFNKMKRTIIFSMSTLLMFFMSLVPIVTLYFMYVVTYQNDRYGYLAAIFFYPALMSLFFTLPRNVYKVLIPIYISILMFLGYQSIYECRNAGKVLDNLLNNFESCDEEMTILLGLPDNYKGKYLYRDLTDKNALTFKESIELFSNKDCSNATIIDAAQYNQHTINDRVLLDQIDSSTVALRFGQYHNWWWKDGIGFRDFNNGVIDVKIDDGKVIVKDLDPSNPKVFLRPDGTRWQRFEFE